MSGRFGAVLLFVPGAVVAQQVVFGGYLDYVKPAQGPWLLAAGFGLVGMLAAPQPARDRPVLHTHGPLAASPEEIARARNERRAADRDDHRRVSMGTSCDSTAGGCPVLRRRRAQQSRSAGVWFSSCARRLTNSR